MSNYKPVGTFKRGTRWCLGCSMAFIAKNLFDANDVYCQSCSPTFAHAIIEV